MKEERECTEEEREQRGRGYGVSGAAIERRRGEGKVS